MSKFMNLELLGVGTKMMINVDHIYSVIDKPDYRIVVTDLYDSPSKRKTYKVRDTYESIYDRLMR